MNIEMLSPSHPPLHTHTHTRKKKKKKMFRVTFAITCGGALVERREGMTDIGFHSNSVFGLDNKHCHQLFPEYTNRSNFLLCCDELHPSRVLL